MGGIPIRESDLIAHTVPPVPQVSDLPRIYGDEPAQEPNPEPARGWSSNPMPRITGMTHRRFGGFLCFLVPQPLG